MKALWKYLIAHIRADFNKATYLLIFLFLAIALFLNYRFHIVNDVIKQQTGVWKLLLYFVMYAVAYYVAVGIVRFTKHKQAIFTNRKFWFKSLLAIFVLSLDTSLPYLRDSLEYFASPVIMNWLNKTAANLISFVTILLPLYIYYRCNDEPSRFYGLSAFKFDKRPYVYMLLIMVPIIIAASFHSSFVRQYPMYKTSDAHSFLDVPEFITAGIYELAYGLDFITVELLFRGFLVIGMIRVLGRDAIIAMASLYCFLHFGKPAGEAISSIFGGYILGVIAMETRSIWGGIMVHLGVAWMMELVAFVQKSM